MDRLKASQIDHLSPGYQYELIADFEDLNGVKHKAGGQWLFEGLEMHLANKTVYLKFKEQGEIPLTFGRKMRELFSDGELPAAKRKPVTYKPVPLPEALPEEPYEQAVLLVRAHMFDKAEKILEREKAWGREAGEWLAGVARRLAFEEPLAAKWLYDRSISAWYSWTSQATSGGEGADRVRYVKDVEREYQQFLATLPPEYR